MRGWQRHSAAGVLRWELSLSASRGCGASNKRREMALYASGRGRATDTLAAEFH